LESPYIFFHYAIYSDVSLLFTQKLMQCCISELLKGNENPGLGSKNLFKEVYYLRGRNGARIFYRKTAIGFEILGKADKANEQTVINILKKLYE